MKQKRTKTKKTKPKAVARATKPAKPKAKAKPKKSKRRATARRSKWLALVEKHGLVLASAHGPVPNLAEAVAGEPIVEHWWSHSKGKAIFAALSEVEQSTDVRCFKLVDQKVTFVHRRLWPALVRLARDGVLADDQVAAIRQEHLPTGSSRSVITPLAVWTDKTTARLADDLTTESARAQLGSWLAAPSSPTT